MNVRIPPQITKNQQMILKEQMSRYIKDSQDRLNKYCDALMLLTLHDQYGFGEKRLRDFWHRTHEQYVKLMEHYEVEGEDMGKVVLHRLKMECGIDMDELESEKIENEDGSITIARGRKG